MYYFCLLTDFYTSSGFEFGIALKMLYLCIVNHERQSGKRPPDVVGRNE